MYGPQRVNAGSTAVAEGTREAERDRKQKNQLFPFKFLEKLAKTSIFEVPRSSRVDWYRNFRFSSYPDPFRPKSSFFTTVFEDFQRFPKVSKGFRGVPGVSDGFRGFPKVSEGFRRFLIFHFFRLFWTLSDD